MLAVLIQDPAAAVAWNSRFLPQQSSCASPVIISPTHGGMAGLSWSE